MQLSKDIARAQIASSESIADAQIASSENIADADQEIARINAKVLQAALASAFLDALTGGDAGKRKLAIQAVLIALPEEGPKLVKIVSEEDQDPEVREFTSINLSEFLSNAVAQPEAP